MAKSLVIIPEKCNGCGSCEKACSARHLGVSDPALSRILVLKRENEGFYFPICCHQCQDAPCMAVCPKEAIYRDEELDRVLIDYDRCISCRMCIAACPFGVMGWEEKRGRNFKCDLCEGNPECVRFCDVKAIDYVEVDRLQLQCRLAEAEIFSGFADGQTE